MEEVTKNQRKEFKVGDRVYAPHFGEGIVTGIDESKNSIYPIHVKWTKTVPPYHSLGDCFTPDGRYTVSSTDSEFDIVSMEEQVDKKVDTKSEKFKVGDMVWSLYFGIGTVKEVQASNPFYQVQVRWSKHAKQPWLYDYFLFDGRWCDDPDDEEKGIVALEVIDLSDLSDDSGVVDRMMDALDKKTDDAINPSHYKVKDLPEAYEIITHLMHREQLEGFYWGNIIKYAYRYGRKGDKAETAGKIKWYAQKLKELGECESK